MVSDLFSVQNKVVIVTGGLGQLGRQFSLALAERGAKVAIFDIQVDDVPVAENFGGPRLADGLRFLRVDITRRDSVEARAK